MDWERQKDFSCFKNWLNLSFTFHCISLEMWMQFPIFIYNTVVTVLLTLLRFQLLFSQERPTGIQHVFQRGVLAQKNTIVHVFKGRGNMPKLRVYGKPIVIQESPTRSESNPRPGCTSANQKGKKGMQIKNMHLAFLHAICVLHIFAIINFLLVFKEIVTAIISFTPIRINVKKEKGKMTGVKLCLARPWIQHRTVCPACYYCGFPEVGLCTPPYAWGNHR